MSVSLFSEFDEEIVRFFRRLCPDLCFFQRQTDHPCAEILNQEGGFENLHKRIVSTSLKVDCQSQSTLLGQISSRSHQYIRPTKPRLSNIDTDEYEILNDGCEAHWQVVERILFVYSKLNSGQSYVQGMNEIIGPIYYTFATDSNLEWRGTFNVRPFFNYRFFFRTC